MKTKEVKLRDLKKITALEEEVFIENAFRADLIGKLIENNLYFLKLEIGKIRKNLLGFIIVIKDRDDRANIINFLIKSKFQNKGYGSYLLQKTIEKVKEDNYPLLGEFEFRHYPSPRQYKRKETYRDISISIDSDVAEKLFTFSENSGPRRRCCELKQLL